jgi:hypothetical protein
MPWQEFYKDEWIPVILPHDQDATGLNMLNSGSHGVLNRSMIRGVHTLTGGDCQALSGGCLGIREVIMDAEKKWYPLVMSK